MCGRYAFFSPAEAVKRIFRVEFVPDLEPRYNVAPTQDVPVVRAGKDGGCEFVMLHWDLIPFWAKDRAIGNRMINARVESVADKPACRDALASDPLLHDAHFDLSRLYEIANRPRDALRHMLAYRRHLSRHGE